LKQDQWYTLKPKEVLHRLDSDLKQGLTPDEAKKRREIYGPNALKEPPPRTMGSLFVQQLQEPLVLILLGAAVVSGFLGQWQDALVILSIVLLNSALGMLQEHKAEEALKALQEMIKPMAKVLRGGELRSLPAGDLVPGDVFLLEAGDYVPADARILTAAALQVNEAPLTGESLPVEKGSAPLEGENIPLGDRTNMLYMGTTVTGGSGWAVAVNTGIATELGRIAQILEATAPEKTPLEERMKDLGRYLVAAVLLTVVMVFFIGLWRGEGLLTMFMTAISLAVAAVPEGLPAVVTIVLALGVSKMSRQQAIIRRLPAVETLGATTVICSDKTGTLTQNQMTVTGVYLGEEVLTLAEAAKKPPLARLLRGGVLNCNAVLEETQGDCRVIGDPTEGALVLAAQQVGLDWEGIRREHPRLAQIPFSSERKLMTGFYPMQGQVVSYTTGAPEVVLQRAVGLCPTGTETEPIPLTAETREELLEVNSRLASQGKRVLALATRSWEKMPDKSHRPEAEKELNFVGFFALEDPPRDGVKEAIATCRRAGIRTVMITGDHRETALAIARDLGIHREGDGILTGPEIEGLAEGEFLAGVKNTTVYARVSPEHKLRIVSALKKHRHVVAMTGDGVNDAPALKQADIGVAMGITGTEVAKQASDMVLLDDNFTTIVKAVAEGRRIYDNIRKTIHYLLSCNIGEVVTVFSALLLGLGSPLSPTQILWVNLITDGPPALALGLDPAEKSAMARSPRKRGEGIFAQGLGALLLYQGFLMGMVSLTAYGLSLRGGKTPAEASTIVFMVVSLQQLIHAFNVRSRRDSLFTSDFFGNSALNYAFIFSLFLQALVIFVPALRGIFGTTLPLPGDWLLILALSSVPLLFEETRKLFRRRISGAE
jgi:Ca2+-transporting ATPase